MKRAPKEQALQDLVREQILELIGHMDFKYSTRLLSENQIASKLKVSRSTIRTVLTELELEGKIIRRHGSGTFVNPAALDVKTTLYPQVNMYDLIKNNNYEPSWKFLESRKVHSRERALKLNLGPNALVQEVHSIYFANDLPCMYCIDCVDANRFRDMDWIRYEQSPGSLYEYIHKTVGVDLTWDIIRIMGAHSDQMPELKNCFSIPEGEIKPLVLLEILNFDMHNRPSVLGNIYVDFEHIHLNMVRDLHK